MTHSCCREILEADWAMQTISLAQIRDDIGVYLQSRVEGQSSQKCIGRMVKICFLIEKGLEHSEI